MKTVRTKFARMLRREQTDAERKLWIYLRAGRLCGLKFRRQHPIGPYYADFCCVEKKLVIELDGGQHNDVVDRARTRFLESEGYRVLRFWDNEALKNIEGVLERIRCESIFQPLPLPAEASAQAGRPLH